VTVKGEVPEEVEVDLIASAAHSPGVTDVDTTQLSYAVDRYGRRTHR